MRNALWSLLYLSSVVATMTGCTSVPQRAGDAGDGDVPNLDAVRSDRPTSDTASDTFSDADDAAQPPVDDVADDVLTPIDAVDPIDDSTVTDVVQLDQPGPQDDVMSVDDAPNPDAGCALGELSCGGTCVDPRSSLDHCGVCGRTCRIASGTGACQMGVCRVVSCNAGLADCDGIAANGCETSLSSALNCGVCGRACAAPLPVCDGANRMCISNCAAPNVMCGMACANLANDNNNCGMCGNRCMLANASPQCAGGNCQIASCQAGFANCDASAANGCETATSADAQNCGACGRRCAMGQACVQGICDFATINSSNVPGSGNCSQEPSYAGKKAAIDSNGVLYLAMSCGASLSVSTSQNQGMTWSPPVNVGINLRAGEGDYAIAPRTGGGVVLAAVQSTGDVVFTQSPNGAMWAARNILAGDALSPGPTWTITILQRANTLLIAYPTRALGAQTGIIVRRNTNDGLGAWNGQTIVANNATAPELLADPNGMTVWLALESAPIYLSNNDGVMFTSPMRGPANHNFSDYAIAGTNLVETGSNSTVIRTALSSLQGMLSSTNIGLLLTPVPTSSRAVAGDPAGNIYTVTDSNFGTVLGRIPAGSNSADFGRSIGAGNSGNHPSVAALPRSRGAFGGTTTNAGIVAWVHVF